MVNLQGRPDSTSWFREMCEVCNEEAMVVRVFAFQSDAVSSLIAGVEYVPMINPQKHLGALGCNQPQCRRV